MPVASYDGSEKWMVGRRDLPMSGVLCGLEEIIERFTPVRSTRSPLRMILYTVPCRRSSRGVCTFVPPVQEGDASRAVSPMAMGECAFHTRIFAV